MLEKTFKIIASSNILQKKLTIGSSFLKQGKGI